MLARRATRQPRYVFPGERKFKLRLAGLAEVNRLKYALTMQAVGEGVPVEVEDEPATVAIPVESMRALVESRAA